MSGPGVGRLAASDDGGRGGTGRTTAHRSAVIPPFVDHTETRVQTMVDPGMKRLGTIRPRYVGEVGASRWTIGCETLDREYADYDLSN